MLKLGIIGCGGVTVQRHLPALMRSRKLIVTALCDTDPARLQSAASHTGSPVTYRDAKDLIYSPDVDAVAVCVPPSEHADLACEVLRANKHLYLEKPIAASSRDARRILAAAAGSRSVAMMGFNLRNHRLVSHASRLIRESALGEVQMVRSTFTSNTRFSGKAPSWRLEQDTGGLLLEQAVHHFDLWRYLLNSDIDEVNIQMTADNLAAAGSARMSSGVLIFCGFSEGTTETNEVDLFGSRAALRLSCYESDGFEVISCGTQMGGVARRIRKVLRSIVTLSRVALARQGGEYAASYGHRWNHFADCIEGRSDVNGDLVDGSRALDIVMAARESAWEKHPVKVPLLNGTASARLTT